jgi:hypothetical protein
MMPAQRKWREKMAVAVTRYCQLGYSRCDETLEPPETLARPKGFEPLTS